MFLESSVLLYLKSLLDICISSRFGFKCFSSFCRCWGVEQMVFPLWYSVPTTLYFDGTLNSTYNEITFNETSAITKENVCTKYTTYTYTYVALNEKPPITKQNLCIFFSL